MKMKKIAFLAIIILLISGCEHQLRITNADAFKPSLAKPLKPVRLGFSPTDDRMLNDVIEKVSADFTVEEARKYYRRGSGIKVDYVCELSKDMRFRASGRNFWITFPGFVIFTHAWHGYKYYADISTQSNLFDPESGRLLSTIEILTPYEFRHTSFARGTWASVGWWGVPWGFVFDIPAGLIFAYSYDHRATLEFLYKVSPSYSSFVSSKVLEQIAQMQEGGPPVRKEFRLQSIVIGDEKIASSGSDRDFAVYVMQSEGGRLMPVSNARRRLPEETILALNRVEAGEASHADVREVLLSLGIPSSAMPDDISTVGIHTMKNDRLVSLFKAEKTGALARRRR